MPESVPSDERRHPIKVVARRTGLTPDVIRIWERRYHAVQPERSEGSRRLYTDAEVERLRLLRRGTLAGRRISELAALPTEGLRAIVEEDEAAAAVVELPPPSTAPQVELLDAAMIAIRALDARALLGVLSLGTMELSPRAFLDGLLIPLLEGVGQEWRSGRIRASHEHMATSVVRAWLQTMHADRDVAPSAPEIVLTTLAGQGHEMGALLAAITAGTEGWRATYLGPDLPTEDIAAAVSQREARVVALSFVYPSDDPHVATELRKLRKLVGERVAIVAGGQAAGAYARALEEIEGRSVPHLEAFRLLLESIRYGD